MNVLSCFSMRGASNGAQKAGVLQVKFAVVPVGVTSLAGGLLALVPVLLSLSARELVWCGQKPARQTDKLLVPSDFWR